MTQRRFCTRNELRSVYGIQYSDTHLRYLERAGNFPVRVKWQGYRCMWNCARVEEWLDEQAATVEQRPR